MKTIEELKMMEYRILSLRNELPENLHKENKKYRKLIILEKEQNNEIRQILENTKNSFKYLSHENQKLLINDEIRFKATQEEGFILTSYSKKFEGCIHHNGYLYMESTQTNVVYFLTQKGLYPFIYTGNINYMGDINISIEKKKYRFFGGRVPLEYKGSIDQYGNISIQTIKSYIELEGSIYVNRIMADVFKGDRHKRNRFIHNKDLMENEILYYRDNLI